MIQRKEAFLKSYNIYMNLFRYEILRPSYILGGGVWGRGLGGVNVNFKADYFHSRTFYDICDLTLAVYVL